MSKHKETIEEAAEKYADFSNDYVPMSFGGKFNETTKRDFIAGAKEQAERMYSEEEVKGMLFKVGIAMRYKGINYHSYFNHKNVSEEVNKVLEQHKKQTT
jgi:hypothetical protein